MLLGPKTIEFKDCICCQFHAMLGWMDGCAGSYIIRHGTQSFSRIKSERTRAFLSAARTVGTSWHHTIQLVYTVQDSRYHGVWLGQAIFLWNRERLTRHARLLFQWWITLWRTTNNALRECQMSGLNNGDSWHLPTSCAYTVKIHFRNSRKNKNTHFLRQRWHTVLHAKCKNSGNKELNLTEFPSCMSVFL